MNMFKINRNPIIFHPYQDESFQTKILSKNLFAIRIIIKDKNCGTQQNFKCLLYLYKKGIPHFHWPSFRFNIYQGMLSLLVPSSSDTV